MNVEQMKDIIADAIDHRTPPFDGKDRAKYAFWCDKEKGQIGCSWAPKFVPSNSQKIVCQVIFNPKEGFTIKQWDELANKFMSFLFGKGKDK